MKKINVEQTIQQIITFIQITFKEAGFTDAVIAVSGGIDSALSCTLAVKALGKDHVYPLFLPYGLLNQKGVEDGQLVTSFLQIPRSHILTVDIQPMVDSIITYDPTLTDQPLRKGNIMARTRMIVLFDQAKKRNALVVGTENKSEHYLGYFTRFGDEASDIEPIRELYKTQVYELAEFLQMPEPILTKAPTAGLWEGQTDEGEFGFSYREADEILSMSVDEGKNKKEIIENGVETLILENVLNMVSKNSFKHNHTFKSAILKQP